MTPLELLAPAKNLACGIAAIDHGADAVYIGAPHFGARAAAGNSLDDIRQLCSYAHPFGVKIYVTLNTIVYDNELDEVHHLIDQLAEIGVDAVLVQDMGLLQFMQDKPFEIHASTQTDNRTVEKVRWLQQIGFSRAVLARDSGSRHILHYTDSCSVHGRLLLRYDGQPVSPRSVLGVLCNSACRVHDP